MTAIDSKQTMQTTDKNTRRSLLELLVFVLLLVFGTLIDKYFSELIGKSILAIGTLLGFYLWLKYVLNPFNKK